jgi:hypothetical protein
MNADPSVTTPDPWLQLLPKTGKGGSTESGKNYAHFLVYRDLPISERSISRAARQVKKSVKYLEKLSSKFDWPPRTTAWDRHEAENRAVQQQQAAREKQELRTKRQQDLIEEKFQVGQELIDKGRALLKLPSTERVIERGDGSKVVVRPSRSAKPAVDCTRLGFELKSQSLAEDLAQNSPFEEINDYTIDPYSPTEADSKTDDPPPGPAKPGKIP